MSYASLPIRLAKSNLHVELQLPSGRWLSIPLDKNLPVRLPMILQVHHEEPIAPTLNLPGNPTAEAIAKAWDIPTDSWAPPKQLAGDKKRREEISKKTGVRVRTLKVRRFDSKGNEEVSLEDIGL